MDTSKHLSFVILAALGGTLASPTATADSESIKFLASDGEAGDWFGYSVAISETTALIGAPTDDDNGTSSGSAYLFDTTTGAQLMKLLPDDGLANDAFGSAVAICGTTAIVGSPGHDDQGASSGAAYVFDTITGRQITKLVATDGGFLDFFGSSVGISGATAIVGAPRDGLGSAYLFDTTTGLELAKLVSIGSSFRFGTSVGIAGTTAVVGARASNTGGSGSGAAFLFGTNPAVQIAQLNPGDNGISDGFGTSVAISDQFAVGGSPAHDDDPSRDTGNVWNSGAVHVFSAVTGEEVCKLLASDAVQNDSFGSAVAISRATVLVGALQHDDNGISSGSAYLFDASTGAELAKLLPSDGAASDYFGGAVAIHGPSSLVGATGEDTNGLDSGAAYLFRSAPVNYCTAGTSASNCQALLSSTGTASASAPSGFVLHASGVEGDKDSQFFFGSSGRQAMPWGNGTSSQCVVPPVQRAGLLTGDGTPGTCSGAVAQDLNARWTAKPPQNPGAGAVVQAQLWYRDPLNTSNQTTSLSDAIEFTVGP